MSTSTDGWKYRHNDQDVDEDTFNKIIEDHRTWADDQYKKQAEAYKAAEKESKRKKK